MSKASQIRQKAQEFLSKGQTEKAVQEYRRLISIESKNPNLYNELGDIFLRAGDKSQAVQNFEKAAIIYEKVALYNNAVAVCKKILRIDPDKTDTVFTLAELRGKQKLEGEAVTYYTQYVDAVIANPDGLLQHSQKDVERMVELMGTSEQILAKSVEIFELLGLKIEAAKTYAKLSLIAGEKRDEKKQVLFRRKAEEFAAGLSVEDFEVVKTLLESAKEPAPETPPADGAGAGSGSAPDGTKPAAEAVPQEDSASPAPREGAAPAPTPGDAPAQREDRVAARAPEGAPSAGASGEGIPADEAGEPGLDEGVSEAVEEAEMVAAMSGGREFYAGGGSTAERRSDSAGGPPRNPARAATGPPDTRTAAPAVETPAARQAAAAMETPPARPAAGQEPPAAARSAREQSSNLVEEITSDVEKDDFKSHYDLGMAYLEMGLFTEAIKDFQIASRCEELQLSSMEMIGYCFLKHDQPRLAVKQLTRALELAKGSGAMSLGIHYNLGLAYEMVGELASAREHFEEVYIIDMTFRDVADKMKKLNAAS